MKRILVPAFAAAAIFVANAAMAAEATGTIKSMDTTAHTVTLADGKVYQVPAAVDMTKLKAGEKVKITYAEAAGKMTASAIVAEK